jgi:hypothetical protein
MSSHSASIDNTRSRSRKAMTLVMFVAFAASVLVGIALELSTASLVITTIFAITVFIFGLAISLFVGVWFRAEGLKELGGFERADLQHLKDASAYLQSFVMVLVLIGGAGWGAYTWFLQNKNYRSSLLPALELRIFAEQKNVQDPTSLLGGFLQTNPNARLIEGFVTIKNVGTSKTNLDVCECAQTVQAQTEDEHDVFVRRCEPRARVPTCAPGQGVPKGPIVISRVQLHGDKMKFIRTGRYWLTKSSVDQRADIETTDEIRPHENDKYEFLVPVPRPGIYAVMFTSAIDAEEFDRMKSSGYEASEWPPRWDATTFIEVK